MPRACALALVALFAAVVRPAEPAFAPVAPPPPDTLRDTLKQLKTRRAALDRLAGPHEPFDLTYLPFPAAEEQALLALRPNVVLAHPDLAAAAPWLHDIGTYLIRFVGGGSGGPGLDGLDQLVVCGYTSIEPVPDAGDGDKARFLFRFNAFVARAARPCDWAAAVRAWFPASEVRVHRGYGYRVVRVNFGGLIPGVPDGTEAALFPAPDGRTLVADDVAGVTALIDRLVERRDELPPPGWDRVATAAVAVAVDNRDKQWVINLLRARKRPELLGPSDRTLLAADHFAAGLDLGPTTRLRVVALARNQFQAKHLHEYARVLARPSDRPREQWGAESAAWGELLTAWRDAGKVERTPLGFVYELEVKQDLVGTAVRLMKEKAPLPSGSAAAALPGFLSPPAPAAAPVVPPSPRPSVVPASGDIPRTRSPLPGDQGIPGYLDPAR